MRIAVSGKSGCASMLDGDSLRTFASDDTPASSNKSYSINATDLALKLSLFWKQNVCIGAAIAAFQIG